MQTITIYGQDHEDAVTLPIWHVKNGLAVQRHRSGWAVVHVPSTYLVTGGYASRTDARAVQERLLALPIDWTQSAKGLWRFKELVQTICDTHIPRSKAGRS